MGLCTHRGRRKKKNKNTPLRLMTPGGAIIRGYFVPIQIRAINFIGKEETGMQYYLQNRKNLIGIVLDMFSDKI